MKLIGPLLIGGIATVVMQFAPAKAKFIISFQQEGANVVATGSGTINTASLIKGGTDRSADYLLVAPKFANYGAGVPGQPVTVFTQFSGLSGPSSFGSGDTTNANTFSGGSVVLVGSQGIVDLPVGYVSGSSFSNQDIFKNKTLDGLGLSVGTYTYTFGPGADADSIVVQIGPVAPPPSLQVQKNKMSFFVSSAGFGKGGDLGGLEGADRHCQSLAQAVGAGDKTWHAYLSTQGDNGVNAKDRIGKGPWFNAKGLEIATSVSDLHSENNKIKKENALDESGNTVTPHDMLTGTRQDGTASPGKDDTTCSNWTQGYSGLPIISRICMKWRWFCTGSALVGHHDLAHSAESSHPWNYAHSTPGCGQANLERVGGAGLFYCFAIEP